MDQDRIVVRNVRGRYPGEPDRLDSSSIEAEVTAQRRLVTIRIDDAEHPEFWMEITLEVES